jgi:hypothetical protein
VIVEELVPVAAMVDGLAATPMVFGTWVWVTAPVAGVDRPPVAASVALTVQVPVVALTSVPAVYVTEAIPDALVVTTADEPPFSWALVQPVAPKVNLTWSPEMGAAATVLSVTVVDAVVVLVPSAGRLLVGLNVTVCAAPPTTYGELAGTGYVV